MGVDPLFRAILWELMGVAWELKALLSLHQPGCRILGNAQIGFETVTAHGRKNQLYKPSSMSSVFSLNTRHTFMQRENFIIILFIL